MLPVIVVSEIILKIVHFKQLSMCEITANYDLRAPGAGSASLINSVLEYVELLLAPPRIEKAEVARAARFCSTII